jgi:hypothetical protein
MVPSHPVAPWLAKTLLELVSTWPVNLHIISLFNYLTKL